jgi:prevent-host-death family protein
VSSSDPNLKGNIAELKIAAEATRLGIPVLRPMTEHERYDLVFELGGVLTRVQCKSAPRRADVVSVRFVTNRRGAQGFIRTKYTSDEIDAIAAYCPDLDECFFIPMASIEGTGAINLRLAPPQNGQKAALHFAADYRLGAIAQLGERPAGSREVVGSSPTSSTFVTPGTVSTLGAHEYRNRFGWYMERAAAGESFLITRRGKPYARLSPPHDQLDIRPGAPELEPPEPAKVVPITAAAER